MPNPAPTPVDTLPYPAPCCRDCQWKPCRYLGGSPRIRGFHYLGPWPRLPKDCPAWLKNQTHLDLEKVLQRLNRNELEELYRTGPPRVTGYPLRPEDSPLHLLAHEIPHHRESWLVVAPGSHLDHAVHALYWAYTRALARANPKRKKVEDVDAAAAQSKEAEPALLNPGFVSIEDEKKPGSPETTITEADIGEVVHLKVDTQGLQPADNILFQIFLKGENGQADVFIENVFGNAGKTKYGSDWTTREDDAAAVHYHIGDGHAERKYRPGKDTLYFIAKVKSKGLEQRSGALQLTKTEEAILYYWPGDADNEGEYLLLEKSDDIDDVMTEAGTMNSTREKLMEARAAAGVDAKEKADKVSDAAEKMDSLLNEAAPDPEKALLELYLVKKGARKEKSLKSLIYIRSHLRNGKQARGHWAKERDATVRKQLEKAKKDEDKRVSQEFKVKLWDWHKEESGSWLPHWKFAQKTFSSEKPAQPGERFSGAAEAQFARFYAGAKSSADFDLKDAKVDFGGSAEVSVSLVQGKAKGTWQLPNDHGINLFPKFTGTDKAEAAAVGKELRLRLAVSLQAYGFVGVSASAALHFPNLDLGGKKAPPLRKPASDPSGKFDANVSGDGQAFAGASAGGGVELDLQWGKTAQFFDSLGDMEFTADACFGAGGAIGFMIGFKDGKFHIEMKAGLVTGLGAKGFVNVAVSAEEMLKILGYCFKNVNHHYLDNVQPDAFDNYVAYGFWLAVKYVPELRESFEVFTGASAFTNWLETTGSKIFGKSINKDQLLESLLQNDKALHQCAPQTLGQILRTIMVSHEDGDEDKIIHVFSIPESDHEFKWTIRWASGLKELDQAVRINKHVSDDLKKRSLEAGMAKLKH